ncbi:hypothetical protein [Nocardioides lijunqiniae]|nr:hypothetical protein [Nocardioides lijunqiniae]
MNKFDDNAPLELSIQEMETLDAPGWATATGAIVSALSVAGSAAVAYT